MLTCRTPLLGALGAATVVKTGQKWAKTGEIPKKSAISCGNHGFWVDFTPPKVAL
jgi:hypothetical protein